MNGLLVIDNGLLIEHHSSSIGDTIAWAPYAVEFAKINKCKVILSTFHNNWFENLDEYKNIEFVNPGSNVECYVTYHLGWFKNDDDNNWDRKDMNPTAVNLIPLQQTATDVLGLEFRELNYGVDLGKNKTPYKDKYVVFGPQATSGCKEWVYDNWCKLASKFVDNGYKIFVCGINSQNIPNTIDINGSLEDTATYLRHADIFIGLGSGLSWLNWALGKHTYMINGFAEEGHEFTSNLTKITNDLCIKCWNDPVHVFDPGDWNWCPVYEGTKLQHICQKSITVDQVLNSIKPKSIVIECSNCLGDTIGIMPYIDKYRIDNNCDLSVKINPRFKFLFEKSYPDLNYVDSVEGFDKIIKINYNFYKKLQAGMAEVLGYQDAEWIKPILNIKPKERPIKNKYVVINIQKAVKKWGVSLEDTVNYMQHAEFFIGLSSGLGWLAHSLGTKVAMIANFTDEDHEIDLSEDSYKSIVNKSVCHGCFNNPKYKVNEYIKKSENNWECCPEHNNTNREYECHTSITPEQVFNEIKEWII